MSKLALVRDDKFQLHLTPELHPESPTRLAAIDRALEKDALKNAIVQRCPRLASDDEIASVHSPSYIEALQRRSDAVAQGAIVALDADTYMSSQTLETAKLAAGAGLVAVDALKEGFGSAFVSVRPPGHHALKDSSMGFCLFNNIAVSTRYAQRVLEARRIFIIDWDVHHGNGTQDMFYSDPSVCFVSLHQYPFWPPNSGWFTEDGSGEGRGFNVNIPLPAGTGDRGYLHAWDRLVKPVCLEFEPDLIMLSAGYDAHRFDPLGQQEISTGGYAMLSQRVMDLCAEAGVKVVAFLEGGYNVQALSDSVLATMRVFNAEGAEALADVHVSYLMPGSVEGVDPITGDSSPARVDERVDDLRKHFSQYWQSLR